MAEGFFEGRLHFGTCRGRLAIDRTGDNRDDAVGKVRLAMRIMPIGTANDHSDAVTDRRCPAAVRATVAMVQAAVTVVGSAVAVVVSVVSTMSVARSAMDRELLPMRVKFPAGELARADVLHEANAALRTRLNRHEFRRSMPVIDRYPERLTSVDRSNSLAFDEDVVRVGRLVVDRKGSADARLCSPSRTTYQDDSSQNCRGCSVDGHRFVPSENWALVRLQRTWQPSITSTTFMVNDDTQRQEKRKNEKKGWRVSRFRSPSSSAFAESTRKRGFCRLTLTDGIY